MSLSRAPRGILLAAGVLAAAVTLSACSGDNTGKSGGGGDTNFVTNTGGISTVAKGERAAPGELAGETLDGGRLDVADLKGKIVVLNVWGSWCAPCRAEAKHFSKVAKELKPQGVEFVGINTRNPSKQPAQKFEADYGITYPSLYDPSGKLILHGFPRGTLNPQAIPSTVVLDRDGRIAARSLMALGEDQLRSMIDPLLKESKPKPESGEQGHKSGKTAGEPGGKAAATAAGAGSAATASGPAGASGKVVPAGVPAEAVSGRAAPAGAVPAKAVSAGAPGGAVAPARAAAGE